MVDLLQQRSIDFHTQSANDAAQKNPPYGRAAKNTNDNGPGGYNFRLRIPTGPTGAAVISPIRKPFVNSSISNDFSGDRTPWACG
jgi:hypothetical protein